MTRCHGRKDVLLAEDDDDATRIEIERESPTRVLGAAVALASSVPSSCIVAPHVRPRSLARD